MKKSVFILAVLALTAQVMFAQLKVASNGNIGIQLGTNTPLSALSIGSVGSSYTKATIYSNNANGLLVNRTASDGMWRYGIYSGVQQHFYYSVGIKGESYSSTAQNQGLAYGVWGYAGNAINGQNYGVMGTLAGSLNGAGIVGTTNGNTNVQIPGVYAGYFAGNVKVIGTINGVTIGDSDIRYKKNIVELDKKKSLENILQMSPIEYNLKQTYYETKGDSVKTIKGVYDVNSQVFQKKHYGLIAQDLQKIYPDLVYQNDSGYLSVNYTGLIPMLIGAIKELKVEVDELKGSDSNLQKVAQSPISLTSAETGAETAALFQNTPNPFTQSTRIKYYLPSTVAIAYLCIYDLQGKQLKQIAISERGEGSRTISGSEFPAGIYLYALLADGKEVDVKKMILTE